MITPFAFTHTNNANDVPGDPNFLDYTNAGQSMGANEQPDSLRVEIDALLRPIPHLDLKPFARLILHGNAGAYYDGNGTIFDNGFLQNAYATFHFLDQSVIEKTFQLGADAAAYFRLPFGSIKVYGSYTFQYILDPLNYAGLPAGASTLNNFFTIGFLYLI